MKRYIKEIALILFVLFLFTTFELHSQQGGFRGPRAGVISVAEALTLRDDAPVILRGYILRYLGNERYIFSDSTGSITVEIERRVWGNLSIDENDLVEISGEIDRDRNRIEVEVVSIRRI